MEVMALAKAILLCRLYTSNCVSQAPYIGKEES